MMLANQSPYWLRLNGTWVHLDGVKPSVEMTPNRATSDFTSVDGVRWTQQAPKGPRDWSLSYEYATPDAVAALSVAAEIATDVWLLDSTLAQANMLAPLDCFGTDTAAGVVDCGGIPLRALDLTTTKSVTVLVRAGITYYVRLWGGPDETGIGSVAYPGGSQDLVPTVEWPNIWPDDWPSATGLVAPFVPTSDGEATITLAAGTAGASGLMLTQDIAPETFLSGARTPCQVSVGDPGRTVNMAWPTSYAWSDYTVSVREVG